MLTPADTRMNHQQEEIARLKTAYSNLLDDFRNYKSREEQKQQQYQLLANKDLITAMLPIISDLARAAKHSSEPGLKLLYNNLLTTLRQQGVEAINVKGFFNPVYHEAICAIPNRKYPDNLILEEVETGFLLHGQVIKPALVKVGQNKGEH